MMHGAAHLAMPWSLRAQKTSNTAPWHTLALSEVGQCASTLPQCSIMEMMSHIDVIQCDISPEF